MSLVSESHAAELVRGAQALGVELSEGQQQQLLAYLALLIKWNKAYNLTAVPLAVAGLVPPWAAALGMSASSLLVTVNASRIARWQSSSS